MTDDNITDDNEVLDFDDFVINQDELVNAKILHKTVYKNANEIEITEDDKEILMRELENTPFRNVAKVMLNMIFSFNKDKMNEAYYYDYTVEKKFHLSWLVPIVRDEKLIYKRSLTRMRDPNRPMSFITDPTAVLQTTTSAELKKQLFKRELISNSQGLLNVMHNYKGIPPFNVTENFSGNPVLRITDDAEAISTANIEFRGSYGHRDTIRMRDQIVNKRVNIIGKEDITSVSGEPLNVVGFARLPINYPNSHNNQSTILQEGNNIASIVEIELGNTPEELNMAVRRLLLTPLQVLQKYDNKSITNILVIKYILGRYGYSLGNLDEYARNHLMQMVLANLGNQIKSTYEVRLLLDMSSPLEGKYLINSPILAEKLVSSRPMLNYGLPNMENQQKFLQYMQISRKADRGDIWIAVISHLLADDDISASTSSQSDIDNKVLSYDIKVTFLRNYDNARKSYYNFLSKTKHDPRLLDFTSNPLDSITDLNENKRDRIAWYHYFKNARYSPKEKKQTNYYYKGRYLGCQHEYDRLYKLFEDPLDSFPYEKAYSQAIDNNGLVCSFCGDILVHQDMMIDQGYDSKTGQKIFTYNTRKDIPDFPMFDADNSILHFERNKTEVEAFGEKMVNIWVNNNQRHYDSFNLKVLRFKILSHYNDQINSNYFQVGLKQDPNLLLDENFKFKEFAEFLIERYKIEKPKTPINFYFIQQLTRPFAAMLSVYDLVIKRMAALLVSLNWYHINYEESLYINPMILFNMFTMEDIGTIFLTLQLKNKSSIQHSDKFFNQFQQQFRTMFKEKNMSEMALDKLLTTKFEEYSDIFLYNAGKVGTIFNGSFSFAHEFVRLLDEFRAKDLQSQSPTQNSTLAVLKAQYLEYWAKWAEANNERLVTIEKELSATYSSSSRLISNQPDPDDRPLYDVYVAQQIRIKEESLHKALLSLVNEYIYQIYDKTSANETMLGDYENLLMKKYYYLDRLECDDWSSINELAIGGIEVATDIINVILKIKNELRSFSLAPVLYYPPRAYIFVPDFRPRIYEIFHNYISYDNFTKDKKLMSKLKIIDLEALAKEEQAQQKRAEKLTGKEKSDIQEVNPTELVNQQRLRDLYKLFNFVDNIKDTIQNIGSVIYMNDVKKDNLHKEKVMDTQLGEMKGCNVANSYISAAYVPKMETTKFEQTYKEVNKDKDRFNPLVIKIRNLRNYIVSYLRTRIYLLSNIRTVDDFYLYNMVRYVRLIEIHGSFYEAFNKFVPSISTDDLDKLIDTNIAQDNKQHELINILQFVFLDDLGQHLEKVNIISGQYRGKKQQKGESTLLNVFTEFIKILLSDISLKDILNNTALDHFDMGMNFILHRSNINKESIKNIGETDKLILKYRLTQDEVIEDMEDEGPKLDDYTLEEDENELDMENDEDDYNDLE